MIAERKKNNNNPIWTNHGNKKYIQLSKKYNKKLLNFCDDHAISQSILSNYYHKYFIQLLKILNSLKIKNFILPLYGKSQITDNNYLMFNKKLNSLAKIASSKRINLLIESNISPNTFRKLSAWKSTHLLLLTSSHPITTFYAKCNQTQVLLRITSILANFVRMKSMNLNIN